MWLSLSAIAVSLILLLVSLALMREIVILRGDVSALSQLITSPPDPRIIGHEIPQRIFAAVASGDEAYREDAQACAVFMADDCGACSKLADDIAATVGSPWLDLSRFCAVVDTHDPDASYICRKLLSARMKVIHDHGATLAKECDVRGTPMSISFLATSGIALDYKYGGDLHWISERMRGAATYATNSD